MKVRIEDVNSLRLIAENDAEQALIDHWKDKTAYTYNHYDNLGSGIGVVFCDDDAPKEFVREEEEEEEENPFIKLQLRIKKVVEQFNEAFGGVEGVDMADVRDMLKNITTPTPAAEQELQDVGIEPSTPAEQTFDEMVKDKVAEYGKWTRQTVTMFNNATVTSAPVKPTPKFSLWGNVVEIEEEEPTPLVIQVDEATSAKIKTAWEKFTGGVVASNTAPPTDEEAQELAKEIAELEELKVFFEDCLAEQELLGLINPERNSQRTTRMFNAALNMVKDLLGEEHDKQA